jgi:hypothetical protein
MKTSAAFVFTALSAVILPGSALADDDDRVRATLTGYQEVPSVSTVARGSFKADIHRDGNAFDWELEYSGLQGNVTQAHIHFAQRHTNGAIVVWLCQTATNPGPAGTAMCPQSGRVTGTAMAGNVGPGAPAQQLTAGEIAEVIAAMRAGAAYANVHTSISGGGEIRGQINDRGRGHDRDHRH